MDIETVEYIHEYLANYFKNSTDPISPSGIKDKGMLQSAISRPFASAGGNDAYPSEFDKAAALFHGLINNHPFFNGNKRTALLTTLYFLGDYNFVVEKCTDDELYEFTKQVAAHNLTTRREDELDIIREWFSSNSRKLQKGEQVLKFKELQDALERFGFSLEQNGSRFDIYKDGIKRTSVIRKGDSGMEDYDKDYISKLRKKLNLTPFYGVDSAKFYGYESVAKELSKFMELRIEVMHKLAKI